MREDNWEMSERDSIGVRVIFIFFLTVNYWQLIKYCGGGSGHLLGDTLLPSTKVQIKGDQPDPEYARNKTTTKNSHVYHYKIVCQAGSFNF